MIGPITDRIGFTLSLIILAGFTAICTTAAIVIGEPGAILFAIAGAGIAPVYPTIMAFVAKRYGRNSDTAITFIVTLMGIGSVIGNYLIGAIIEGIKAAVSSSYESDLALLRGLQSGYGFIALCALLCSLFSFIMYRYLKKRNALL
ncbi:Major Facilitator Superfamily protein [compost metagenome]